MRICIISPKSFPVPALKGGAVETLITNFIEQNELYKKLEIEIVTRYDKECVGKIKNYKESYFNTVNFNKNIIYCILSKLQLILKSCFLKKCINKLEKEIYNRAIISTIKEKNFDFIITDGGNFFDYEWVYKKIDRRKSILHIHGSMEGIPFLKENFEYFICISEFIAGKLLQSGIIKKENTKLLYNGVLLKNFSKNLDASELKRIKQHYGIKNDEKVILFCGRTVEEKGVKELILAYKKIYTECKAKLMIVGNSNFANQIVTEYDKELTAISQSVNDNIIFTGHISNNELYKVYGIADIAVFPSLCEEAFGLVLIEAMAMGIPIITTKSGAIPEVVTQDCAFVLEKDDKQRLINELAISMKKLLEDDDLKNKMSQAGKERAKSFSIEQYYNNFVTILEELKEENENRNIDISKCT